jgi:hypothetical protein
MVKVSSHVALEQLCMRLGTCPFQQFTFTEILLHKEKLLPVKASIESQTYAAHKNKTSHVRGIKII